jgi:hypothetical protein
MRIFALATLLSLIAVPALAESWNCQFPGHGGLWRIDGTDLVAPATSGATRFAVVRNTPDSLVALSDEFSGRRFELVTLDRRKLGIRISMMGMEGNAEQRETGTCAVPDARTAAVAQAVSASVRPRIRALVKQAQNLANQGFTTAANLKLTEAAGFEHVTPEENQLIGQMRQVVAAKPRR